MKTFDSNELPKHLFDGQSLTDKQVEDVDEHFDDWECLVEVEDFFGSDYIIKYNDRYIMTDRNCGFYVFVDEQQVLNLLKD